MVFLPADCYLVELDFNFFNFLGGNPSGFWGFCLAIFFSKKIKTIARFFCQVQNYELCSPKSRRMLYLDLFLYF
jgi:hypothetical protein